jgi:hypothetical protein
MNAEAALFLMSSCQPIRGCYIVVVSLSRLSTTALIPSEMPLPPAAKTKEVDPRSERSGLLLAEEHGLAAGGQVLELLEALAVVGRRAVVDGALVLRRDNVLGLEDVGGTAAAVVLGSRAGAAGDTVETRSVTVVLIDDLPR